MNKMNVLITGASGNVGLDVFKEIYSKKEQYVIFLFLRGSKKNRKLFKPYKKDVNIIWGNILKYEDLKRAVKNKDLIIHLAGIIPPKAYKDPDYTKKVNVGGTENLLKSIEEQKLTPKIIYTSSIAVYGDRLKDPYIEIEDDPNPNDIYSRTKLKSENIIRNSGLDYIIFRLSFCFSVGILKFNPVLFKMPLKTKLEIIDTEDVAVAIVRAIEKKEIWNNIYNLGGGGECRILYKKFLNKTLKLMGFGDNFLPDEAFSKKGFNCGFIENGVIQQKLQYQQHTLEDFYDKVRDWIGIKRYFVPIVKWFVKKYLLNKSPFYKKNRGKE